jgi:hypothetical protein
VSEDLPGRYGTNVRFAQKTYNCIVTKELIPTERLPTMAIFLCFGAAGMVQSNENRRRSVKV